MVVMKIHEGALISDVIWRHSWGMIVAIDLPRDA